MKTNVININGVDVELEGNPFDNSVTTQKVVDKAITKAKLADALQGEIDGKYVKPLGGIPASDIAPGVIPDVSQFITRSVNDLVNYYLKSDTYTKAEVQTLIDAVRQFTYEVVETLPTASASTMHKIYLVPSTEQKQQNVKDEYITIQNGTTYSWEQIGSTAIDLSNYHTIEQETAAINSAIAPYKTEVQIKAIIEAYGYETSAHASATYQPKEEGKGLSTNDYDNTAKGKVNSALQPEALRPYRTSSEQDTYDSKKVDSEGGELAALSIIINLQNARIEALENALMYGLKKLVVDNLEVRCKFNQFVSEGNSYLRGAGAPSADIEPENWSEDEFGPWTGIPQYIGQRYLNTSSGKWYTAKGNAAVADWVQDTNA